MANIIAHQRTSRSFYLDVEIFILVYKIELHLVAQSLENRKYRTTCPPRLWIL
jgi:hypothetical protein